jgi:hypothetical protein
VSPRADIGVLLVHGIGDHQEGETLTSFGEPLVDWMREWLTGKRRTAATGSPDEHSELHIGAAQLQALPTEAEATAYAIATLTAPRADTGEPDSESWLFCEAWWGGSVQPPKSLRLLLWIWSRAPLLIYWHYYVGFKPGGAEEPRPSNLLRMLFAFGLAATLQVIVAIALVLWVIPIGPWRRAVLAVVRAMTLTLGDSYALLELDIQRGALIERVRRALMWLADRVDKVIVVAHSQGGAIAHEALRIAALDKVRVFASVGSGLEKLQFLRVVRERQTGFMPAAVLFPLAALTAASWYYGEERVVIALTFALGAVTLVTMVLLGANLRDFRVELFKKMEQSELRATEPLTWIDLHASHDAVSMGRRSIFSNAAFVERIEIFNERSLIRDHTGYFTNRSSFLWQLWRVMGSLSKLALVTPADAARLDRQERAYRDRARVLSFCRMATLAACGFILVQAHRALATFGETVIEAVRQSPISEVTKPLLLLGNGVEWLVKNLWGTTPFTAGQVAASVFASVLLIGSTLIWWLIYRSIWRAHTMSRWRKACRGKDALQSHSARVTHFAECGTFLIVGCLPLAVAVLQALSPEALTAQSLLATAAALLGLILIGMGTAYFAAGPWFARAAWRDSVHEPLLSRLWGPTFACYFGLFLVGAGAWVWPSVPEPLLIGCWAFGGFGWPAFALVSYRSVFGVWWLSFVCLAPLAATAMLASPEGIMAAAIAFYPLSIAAFVVALVATHYEAIGSFLAQRWRETWRDIKRLTSRASRT